MPQAGVYFDHGYNEPVITRVDIYTGDGLQNANGRRLRDQVTAVLVIFQLSDLVPYRNYRQNLNGGYDLHGFLGYSFKILNCMKVHFIFRSKL